MKHPNDVRDGMKVKTNHRLRDTRGMLIKPDNLLERRCDSEGTIEGYVAGHGGEVWWVRHSDGKAAPYIYDEFEELTEDTP